MSHIIKPHIAVFINYVKPFKSPEEARFVYSQFAKLGNLTWWHDYTSPAGYKHYGGRSMAIYTFDNARGTKMLGEETRVLTDDLMSIVGLPLLNDWKALNKNEKKKIEPVYHFQDTTPSGHALSKISRPEFVPKPQNVVVKAATKYEPFFMATMRNEDVGYMSNWIKMKVNDSIPLRISIGQVSNDQNGD